MRAFLAPLFLLTLASGQAFAWGCEGHAMVALIARAHLTPNASAAIDSLLKENPIDPALKRFCQDRPADPMADAATWADDARIVERTSNWHYVDIPLTVNTGTKLDEWCPPIGSSTNGKERPGCVTNALEYEWSILRDTAATPADRAAALRYVIHFVGDMHQPLHDSDNDDRGGNCTVLKFFDEGKPANLHAVWDYKILQRELTAKHATVSDYAASLDRRFASNWPAWSQAGVHPQDWAWEGHAIAVRDTYGDLSPVIPFEKPGQIGCDAEREKVSALHISIGDDYYNRVAPIVDRQIAQAGYRLATLLNSTF